MKTSRKILAIFGLLFLILISVLFFYIFRDTTIEAYLLNFNENVSIIRKGVSLTPEENMLLKEKDIIKTGDTGEATIVLFDSVIVDIDPNSEVELQSLIKDNLKLKQNSGTTWNKFLNTLGISNYEVETPNAVAIVRGTEFRVSCENNLTSLLTAEGKVEFRDRINHKRNIVLENEILIMNKSKTIKRNITIKEQREILEQKQRFLNNLKKIRVLEVEKKDPIIDPIKERFKITREKTIKFIDDLDNGKTNESVILKHIPFKTPRVDKFIKYDDEARKLVKQIDELNRTLIISSKNESLTTLESMPRQPIIAPPLLNNT